MVAGVSNISLALRFCAARARGPRALSDTQQASRGYVPMKKTRRGEVADRTSLFFCPERARTIGPAQRGASFFLLGDTRCRLGEVLRQDEDEHEHDDG